MYDDDNLLMLSGIQHFAFCQRQWALVHIEQQWHDNHLTIEGEWLHRHVDNPFEMGRHGDIVHLNAVSVVSYRLGLYGVADLLELHQADGASNTIRVLKYPGDWLVCPIEYKHGRPKENDCDEVQLCAQAMCLEEMYGIRIDQGALYYLQTRRRTTVPFSDNLRQAVMAYADAMHEVFEQGKVPEGKYLPRCKSCSMSDHCMADTMRHDATLSVYLEQLKQ